MTTTFCNDRSHNGEHHCDRFQGHHGMHKARKGDLGVVAAWTKSGDGSSIRPKPKPEPLEVTVYLEDAPPVVFTDVELATESDHHALIVHHPGGIAYFKKIAGVNFKGGPESD